MYFIANNLALRSRTYFLELNFTFLKTNNVNVFCTGKSEKFNFCVRSVCQRVEVVVSVVVVSKLILIGKIGQYLWIEGKVCWKSFFRTPVLLSRKVLEWHAMMVLGQFRQGYKLKYKIKYKIHFGSNIKYILVQILSFRFFRQSLPTEFSPLQRAFVPRWFPMYWQRIHFSHYYYRSQNCIWGQFRDKLIITCQWALHYTTALM